MSRISHSIRAIVSADTVAIIRQLRRCASHYWPHFNPEGLQASHAPILRRSAECYSSLIRTSAHTRRFYLRFVTLSVCRSAWHLRASVPTFVVRWVVAERFLEPMGDRSRCEVDYVVIVYWFTIYHPIFKFETMPRIKAYMGTICQAILHELPHIGLRCKLLCLALP